MLMFYGSASEFSSVHMIYHNAIYLTSWCVVAAPTAGGAAVAVAAAAAGEAAAVVAAGATAGAQIRSSYPPHKHLAQSWYFCAAAAFTAQALCGKETTLIYLFKAYK